MADLNIDLVVADADVVRLRKAIAFMAGRDPNNPDDYGTLAEAKAFLVNRLKGLIKRYESTLYVPPPDPDIT